MIPDAFAISAPTVAPYSAEADALLRNAAHGDILALRGLREFMVDACLSGTASRDQAFWGVEPIARMAAARGGPNDRKALCGVLLVLADIARDHGEAARADNHMSEALIVLDALADEGDTDASVFLDEVASTVTPEVIAAAREAVISLRK